jgi:hypothetical protein
MMTQTIQGMLARSADAGAERSRYVARTALVEAHYVRSARVSKSLTRSGSSSLARGSYV